MVPAMRRPLHPQETIAGPITLRTTWLLLSGRWCETTKRRDNGVLTSADAGVEREASPQPCGSAQGASS